MRTKCIRFWIYFEFQQVIICQNNDSFSSQTFPSSAHDIPVENARLSTLIWYCFHKAIFMWFSIRQKFTFKMAQTKQTFFLSFSLARDGWNSKEKWVKRAHTNNNAIKRSHDLMIWLQAKCSNGRSRLACPRMRVRCFHRNLQVTLMQVKESLKFGGKVVVNSEIVVETRSLWAIYLTGVRWKTRQDQSFSRASPFPHTYVKSTKTHYQCL